MRASRNLAAKKNAPPLPGAYAGAHPRRATMRSVNMEHYKILVQGQEWNRETPPCSRDASLALENNEAVVTWLAPRDALGVFSRHIPVIRYKDKFWTISLRMSKSIYRSVRLRKGFKNLQTVQGVQTLRIPQLLFNEKQRTQARFKVSHAQAPVNSAGRTLLPTAPLTCRDVTTTMCVVWMPQLCGGTIFGVKTGIKPMLIYMYAVYAAGDEYQAKHWTAKKMQKTSKVAVDKVWQ